MGRLADDVAQERSHVRAAGFLHLGQAGQGGEHLAAPGEDLPPLGRHLVGLGLHLEQRLVPEVLAEVLVQGYVHQDGGHERHQDQEAQAEGEAVEEGRFHAGTPRSGAQRFAPRGEPILFALAAQCLAAPGA